MTNQQVQTDDTDRAYFTVTPNLVWALCRNPFDLACWCTVKLIAGDAGMCTLSAEEAGALAGMSAGKWVDCRGHLLAVGALVGSLQRDPGYPQPCWHLRIPDLWPANVYWREATGDALHARIASVQHARQSLHHMKALLAKRREPSPREGEPSCGEGYPSPHEGMPSPRETKKNHQEEPKEEPVRITPAGVGQPPPQGWVTLIDNLNRDPGTRSIRQSYLLPARVALDGDVLTVWTHNCTGADVLRKSNFRGRFVREVARAFGRPMEVNVVAPAD